jgi:hypothetical protein
MVVERNGLAFSTRSTVVRNPTVPVSLLRYKEDAMAKAAKKTSHGDRFAISLKSAA